MSKRCPDSWSGWPRAVGRRRVAGPGLTRKVVMETIQKNIGRLDQDPCQREYSNFVACLADNNNDDFKCRDQLNLLDDCHASIDQTALKQRKMVRKSLVSQLLTMARREEVELKRTNRVWKD
mmetsp:Transcript_667/g.889  ORF Transcript_667/g.889 Transcript_667/m.889 type:complete len:122 (-) Transcript_667:49-414(-)|eukprot:CAMPEP_0175100524 /NCGR_PEP_ID=MMETSP0086_2-20121207/7171_1 /TAXON_ID=136419 /ORGANISM="Unknown Unknown, Strain D1" /LENGTH=121 /DNA_ID=CAMNT_0016374717 /DNA_START=60 /DNA_END=425 /DNA_ORIENTATION=-